MNFLEPPSDRDRGPKLGRWARLRADVATPLRRGGWYPVLSAGAEEAVLEVRGAPTIIARDVVEIVHARPETWSFVPPEWGGPYLVCPDCAERVRKVTMTERFVCPHCHGEFAVILEREIAS
jgi:hypothetical protein